VNGENALLTDERTNRVNATPRATQATPRSPSSRVEKLTLT
jgi:hypothetical protein